MSEGILIGTNADYERYLPWWHHHYKKHNDLPVAILDFGMSPWGLAKAKAIGKVIDAKALPKTSVHCDIVYAKDIATACLQRLENLKKSPFDTTLWLDLDCLVRCDVQPLFEYIHHPSGFAAAPITDQAFEWQKKLQLNTQKLGTLNGGVFLFKKSSFVLDIWVDATRAAAENFHYDDLILSLALREKKIEINWLPQEYNTDASNAKIRHLFGRYNKCLLYCDPNYRYFYHSPFEHEVSGDFGVVLHVEPNTEGLVDWWIKNYRMYNNFPVAINKDPFKKSLKLTPFHIVQGHLTPTTRIYDFQDRHVYLPYAKIVHYTGKAGRAALLAEVMIGQLMHEEQTNA
ncbi:MAG: hypothetical protein KDK50_01960 [Chlamydiia bacterium]|nr:hypothetical protein [Chlamydiia bacterium]